MKVPSPELRTIHNLRLRAEQTLQQSAIEGARDSDPLLHELRLHELELRMQNEAMRELQVELALARERYRDLFSHAPVAYLVLDRDSTVLEANVAAAALLQIDHDELIGRKLSTFVDAAHVEPFVRHMRSVLSETESRVDELSLALPEVMLRDVRMESIRDHLNPQQWRTTLVDLTNVRQLERQLERSRRLEAIGTFSSGIAHDFSNLLATVSGGADLALELVDTPELVTMPLERIKRAAARGRTMIRQLLRFASGPESDSAGVFKLDAAIAASEQALRQALGEAVELEIRLAARDAEVCIDLGGPEEILLNLASNAAHAMREGGKFAIETRTVVANVGLDPRLPPQKYALLTVSDTGAGMDARTQARAFEPFFTTKSGGNGTGLGLAMVYGIVKRAGGHIQLSSELSKGTTFRIYLPLCSDTAASGG